MVRFLLSFVLVLALVTSISAQKSISKLSVICCDIQGRFPDVPLVRLVLIIPLENNVPKNRGSCDVIAGRSCRSNFKFLTTDLQITKP